MKLKCHYLYGLPEDYFSRMLVGISVMSSTRFNIIYPEFYWSIELILLANTLIAGLHFLFYSSNWFIGKILGVALTANDSSSG